MQKHPLPPPASFFDLTFSAAVEWLLNQAIQLDEEQGAGFAPLDEKVIQITLRDIKQTFFLIYQQDDKGKGQFTAQKHLMGSPDASIKAAFIHFLDLKNHFNPENFETTGDNALAQTFLKAVHQLEPDWEEHLSHFTGDLVAHQIGSTVRQAKRTAKEVKDQAKTTFKEYLQFEVELVPTKHQVAAFNQEVDRLAERTQQLADRVEAITNQALKS